MFAIITFVSVLYRVLLLTRLLYVIQTLQSETKKLTVKAYLDYKNSLKDIICREKTTRESCARLALGFLVGSFSFSLLVSCFLGLFLGLPPPSLNEIKQKRTPPYSTEACRHQQRTT